MISGLFLIHKLPHDSRAHMSDLPELPSAPLGVYRHYKGGEYELIGVARHSETLEPLVLYRPLYNASGLWVRPHAMFFEHIEFEGRLQPRFAPVAQTDLKPQAST
jgi:hypothetical protein